MDYTWEIKPTERGVGFTCPRCDGKVVVNVDEVKATRAPLSRQHSLICIYCECISLLPTPKVRKRRKRSRK